MQKFQDQDFLKHKVLSDLHLSEVEMDSIRNKLKDYIYVNDLSDIDAGTFIRTISVDQFKLTNPCVFCEVKITSEGMSLFCRNMYKPCFFHINMDKTIVFRKLKPDEKLIVKALRSLR
jgi:hypothetical protein